MNKRSEGHRVIFSFGLAAIFVVLGAFFLITVGSAQEGAGGQDLSPSGADDVSKDLRYAKFDSQTMRVVRTWEDAAAGRSSQSAAQEVLTEVTRASELPPFADRMEVWIKFDPDSGVPEDELFGLGVEKDDHYAVFQNYVQAVAPVSSLRQISELPGVFQISVPPTAEPAVVSEGVARVNAQNYINAGLRGQGRKVAILDRVLGTGLFLGKGKLRTGKYKSLLPGKIRGGRNRPIVSRKVRL